MLSEQPNRGSTVKPRAFLPQRKRSLSNNLRRKDRRARRSLFVESLEGRQLLAVTTLLNIPGYQPTTAETTLGLAPPDPVGDVGPNHYIQMTNTAGGSQFTVYDKSNGSVLLGPVTTSTLAQGGFCRTGLGDPIVQYDRFADRWMISEFADDGVTDFGLCVYVSQTSDPTDNLWYSYGFKTQLFPDYPKYSVTPDAYFVTTNEQGTVQRPSVYALDRAEHATGLACSATATIYGSPAARFRV